MYIQIVALVARAIKGLFERAIGFLEQDVNPNTPSLHIIRGIAGAIRPNGR